MYNLVWKKKIGCYVVFLVTFVMLLGACGVSTGTPDQKEKTTAAGEVSVEAPAKISFFYQEASQVFPEDFKHEDNWFINLIKERANVEFTEVITSTSAEAETRFNLLMASGKIPDLVERFHVAEMKDYGEKGAFLPTRDIIKNSKNISRFYDDVQLKGMESPDGVAYIIVNPPPNADINVMQARWDLLEKLGYTEPPDTLDGWREAGRKLKEYDPNSIPICTVGLSYAQFIFIPHNMNAHGCGWMYYPERGKVSNCWEGDNIVKAVSFGKQLYNEGVLDQEFVTNSSTDYGQKKLNHNVLVQYNNYGGYLVWLLRYIDGGNDDARLIPVRQPMAPDVGVDEWYYTPRTLGAYAFGISANTKEKDAVVRLLDVLYSDEIMELSTYGREGIDHKVENNIKLPIFPAAMDSAWKSIYGWAFVNNAESLEYNLSMRIYGSGATDDEKADYLSFARSQTNKIRNIVEGKLDYNPHSLAEYISEDLRNLANEVIELQKSLIIKAIMNEISMDDFVMEKENLVNKYQHITDAYNVVTEDAKAKYGLK